MSFAGTERVNDSETALGATFRKIARVKGASVAVFAIARKLAQLVYRMLKQGQDYIDIGEQAYEARFELRRLGALAQTAKALGYTLVKQEDEAVATG